MLYVTTQTIVTSCDEFYKIVRNGRVTAQS